MIWDADALTISTTTSSLVAVNRPLGRTAYRMNDFDLIGHGGRLVYVGLFQGEVTFNDPNFHRREMTLLASRNALPGDFDRIVRLVEDGRINTTPWITHRVAADQLVETLPGWLSPEAGVLKAVVEF